MEQLNDPLAEATQVGREPCSICGGRGWYYASGWPTRCERCRLAELARRRKSAAQPQPARMRK